MFTEVHYACVQVRNSHYSARVVTNVPVLPYPPEFNCIEYIIEVLCHVGKLY